MELLPIRKQNLRYTFIEMVMVVVFYLKIIAQRKGGGKGK